MVEKDKKDPTRRDGHGGEGKARRKILQEGTVMVEKDRVRRKILQEDGRRDGHGGEGQSKKKDPTRRDGRRDGHGGV